MSWLNFKIDFSAYDLGFKAWDEYLITEIKPVNPFNFGSDEFYSWNRGFNSNQNGCD